MDVYLDYKYTGADPISRDMATTSIASVTESEVHRHRIASKTTCKKSLNQNFAPLSRRFLIQASNEAISICRISAVPEIPITFGLYEVRPYLYQERILML